MTLALFLSLINYARQHGYDGILAVSSHPMLHIIKSSGWNVTLLKTGMSERTSPFICCWATLTVRAKRH